MLNDYFLRQIDKIFNTNGINEKEVDNLIFQMKVSLRMFEKEELDDAYCEVFELLSIVEMKEAFLHNFRFQHKEYSGVITDELIDNILEKICAENDLKTTINNNNLPAILKLFEGSNIPDPWHTTISFIKEGLQKTANRILLTYNIEIPEIIDNFNADIDAEAKWRIEVVQANSSDVKIESKIFRDDELGPELSTYFINLYRPYLALNHS